ncbi:MAG: response regulator [Salinirussus sp.]
MPDSLPDRTVLVADDDEELAALIADWLEPRFKVYVVHDGDDAMDMLEAEDIDCVLLDQAMPDKSGDEVLATLRDRGEMLPVALLTGHSQDTDVIGRGYDEYLEKPVTRETVLSTVEDLLEQPSRHELWQEVSELRVKKNILEAERSDRELQDDEQYLRVVERMEYLEDRLGELVTGAAAGVDSIEPAA